VRSYSVFAQYYDELTSNVEYPKRAEYLLELMERLGHAPGLTLDLACGTGSLTLELYKRGVDIYGIDGSVEMLSEARTKCAEAGADILFLCQNMLSIDLYGTVDTALCTLDSLNHLKNGEELQRVFEKVSFFMNPGGYFLFDMNTLYKHQVVLGNETYVYDMDHVYCVGDEANDLPMLTLAAEGFAPANCIPAVRDSGAAIVCHARDGALADVVEILEQKYR